MTKQEFIRTIESTYQCEALDDREGIKLFVDGFFGDLIIATNVDDTFNVIIDVFDTFYDMNYGFDKSAVAHTLAYYKSVVFAIENEFTAELKMTKSQSFDNSRGDVNSIILDCEELSTDIISRVCNVLLSASDGMDNFQNEYYKQALLETISNDIDYKENGGFHLDSGRLMFKSGAAMIFTGDISNALPNVHKDDFIQADDIYIGYKYTIIKNATSDKMVVIDSKYIKQFIRISQEYEIADLKYYSNFSHLVYVESENLNFVVAVIVLNDVAIINEYEMLSKQIFELKRIAAKVSVQTSYNFSHLSDDEFEMLCFDLLNKEGFYEVKRIGKTNAPDGGIDILAYQEFRGLLRPERRKWIVQCKHSKRSLDRKEIAEIGDLLKEHKAQVYGLFCSNTITPNAMTRLESKKEQFEENVQYFGKSELTVFVEKYPDLVIKYRLL